MLGDRLDDRSGLGRVVTVNETGTCSAAPAEASGAYEFGRTVTTGTPVPIFDCTVIAPPKICCVAPSPSTATALVSTPEPILNASRAATSLFSAVDGISTAAGDECPTTAARASAFGATL